MADVFGTFSTQSMVTDERIKDWHPALWKVIPNIDRALTILSKSGRGPALSDPEFNYWEQDDRSLQGVLNEALDNSETGVDVTELSQFAVGDVIQIETQTAGTYETMLVTAKGADSGAGTLTVIRGFGQTAAAACDTATPIFIVKNISAEGSSRPAAVASQMTKRTDYAQIIRATVDTNGTALATVTRPTEQKGEVARRNLMWAMRRIKLQMNRDLYWGQKKESTGVTPVIRSTGGMYEFMDSGNIINWQGAPLAVDVINALAGKVYDQGTPGLEGAFLFIGPAIRRRFSELALPQGTIRLDEARSGKYGFQMESFESAWGPLSLVQDSSLRGSGGIGVTKGATSVDLHGDKIFLFKLPLILIRYLRALKLEKGIQTPGDDKEIDGYIAEYGLQKFVPTAHACARNIKG